METGSRNGRGDAEAMTPETLVRSYASAVLAVCAANTSNLHDAEDVMQDVFLKAIAKRFHHGWGTAVAFGALCSTIIDSSRTDPSVRIRRLTLSQMFNTAPSNVV